MRKNRASASFALGLLLILTSALIWAPRYAFGAASAVSFDFDTGTPSLPPRAGTPFNQTSAGMTAYFSSIADPAGAKFSIQNLLTYPNILLSQLPGNYLFDNSPAAGDSIDIKFSAPLSSINFIFATFEFHGPTGQEPSNITLTAYLDSNSSLLPWRNSTYLPPVGSMIARGVWPTNDTYPEGTLSFSSSQQFNLVRIQLPYQGPQGAIGFSIDNVLATAFNAIPEFSPAVMLSLLIANTILVILMAGKRLFKPSLETRV